MMKVITLLLLVTVTCTLSNDRNLRQIYREWKIKYGKNTEDLRDSAVRFRNFKLSVEKVDMLNRAQSEWVAGLTFFADLSEDEMRAYTGYNETHPNEEYEEEEVELESPLSAADDPAKKYWEMGPVQNQGTCGSCWAFAAIATLEGQHIKEEGVYKGLSDQTLLDCTFTTRNGCDGGWTDSGVNWAGSRGSIAEKFPDHGYLALRDDNGYEGDDPDGCADETAGYWNALQSAKPYMKRAPYKTKNDAGLQHALATQGPTAVSIYSSWALPFYTTGTYAGDGCGVNPQTNHAVVAAGYEKGWWYIRNSWGSGWGYSGYFYMTRSYENLCSVSRHRKELIWNHNKNWSICKNLDPKSRTPCVDDQILDESACEQKGCCYDNNFKGTKEQCFAHGQITLYDSAGLRRVFYGSEADFSHHADDTEFSWAAVGTKMEAEYGTWFVYTEPRWQGYSKVVSKGQDSWDKTVKSIRLITVKDTLTIFAHFYFKGNKITLSKNAPKLDGQFNDEVSSIYSNGNWKVCEHFYYEGQCKEYKTVNFNYIPRTKLCNDCISSVEKLE